MAIGRVHVNKFTGEKKKILFIFVIFHISVTLINLVSAYYAVYKVHCSSNLAGMGGLKLRLSKVHPC